ncbi:hypothetical protein ACSBR1_027350 [Camellia fascicularis]
MAINKKNTSARHADKLVWADQFLISQHCNTLLLLFVATTEYLFLCFLARYSGLYCPSKFLPCHLLMLWNWLHQIVLSRVPVMLPIQLIIVHAFSNSRGNNLRRNILSV